MIVNKIHLYLLAKIMKKIKKKRYQFLFKIIINLINNHKKLNNLIKNMGEALYIQL